MYSTGNKAVDAIGNIHLKGNVIPHTWYHHIKTDKGKPDTIGILILAEVVYWYRPVTESDEQTGTVIKVRKRFKSDLLQRSYKGFEEKFGFTEKQTREALKRLEELGVLERVFRTIEVPDFGKMNNVMFIKVFPEKIAEISAITVDSTLLPKKEPGSSQGDVEETGGSQKGNTPIPEGSDLVPKKELPPDKKGTTNTKITTKSSTKSSTKSEYGEFVTLTEKEYESLVNKYGKIQTDGMIEILDNYKGASGKKYASDYRAILSWVVTKWKEQNGGKQSGKNKTAEELAREINLPF